jgi:hypothetical protein
MTIAPVTPPRVRHILSVGPSFPAPRWGRFLWPLSGYRRGPANRLTATESNKAAN